MNRLTDNDKNIGPFTVAKVDWNPIRFVFSSGGSEEDETANNITVYLFGYVMRLRFPNLIADHKEHHEGAFPSGETYSYDERHSKEYGFCLSEGFLNIFYGPQTMDSSTTKSKGYFLPWTQWRFVRYAQYDRSNELYYESFGSHGDYDIREKCPSVDFIFEDYDGEEITAKTRIEVREWLFGEGWFKWLSIFRPKKIRRSLDLSFSSEVGKEKGSWKGGTVGHGIDMLDGELHEDAFKRYCEQEHRSKSGKYSIKYIGPAVAGQQTIGEDDE